MSYSGTIYEMGQQIPGVVNTIYTPHIWYDQSKTYKNGTNIFEDLFVAESITLGDAEDDVWDYDELLTEILQYLNLHIVMVGYDYYIFDWNTPKNELNVEWLDILTGQTKIDSYSVVNVTAGMYGSNDTQITVDDVYNQVMVTDNIDKLETVIESPFNEDNLTPLNGVQQYMTEYSSTGCDIKSFAPYTWLLKTDDAANMIENDHHSAITPEWLDNVWTKKWYMQIFKHNGWAFSKNNIDNYSVIPTDLNGQPYDCWQMLKKMYDEPFVSGIVGFGSGRKITTKNQADLENVSVKDKYLCISINGSGVDEQSPESHYSIPQGTVQFPNESDLQNLNMKIEYKSPVDATYSPADEAVTNYLVFTGDILMTVWQQCVGVSGFDPDIYGPNDGLISFNCDSDKINKKTLEANDPDATVTKKYVDYRVKGRSRNNFATAKYYIEYDDDYIQSAYDWRGRLCPSEENDDKGVYYNQLFYSNHDASEYNNRAESQIYMSPPIVNGRLSKRFNYSLHKNSAYGYIDKLKYVDILACQLRIGDKYCVQDVDDTTGDKIFTWMTTAELEAAGMYTVNPGQEIHYEAYVYLAIDIDEGQYLIGEEHPIYNNIDTSMNLTGEGMAIPMKASDNLSGALHFTIVGPVNNSWNQGVYRHSTWFRHSSHPDTISILPHVAQIWIKKFDVNIQSDKGKKNIVATDKDIVYCSDEQKKFINKHDDTEFKFTTSLTAEEAAAMGVEYTINRSDVSDGDGVAILSITNNVTNETDKPEKHYVDAYYTEYCDTKMKVDTTLHNSNKINIFNKFGIGYLNKSFYIHNIAYNVITDKKKLTLKEI